MRIGTVLVVIWLAIGALAAGQRGYYSGDEASCVKVSTVVLTVIVGPLNYAGVNPKVKACPKPESAPRMGA